MICTYERELLSDAFHRKHIVLPVQRDPRTRRRENLLLGYPFHLVRYSVIKNGTADFDTGHNGRYGILTAQDVVLLYCYIYLARHHAELLSTFDRCSTWIADSLNSGRATWLVDLGCGPGSAGLAFADHCRGAAFHYLGFDQSTAMRCAAYSLLQLAKQSGRIDQSSTLALASGAIDLSFVQTASPAPVNVLIVASYLFASKSLDIVSLARSLKAVLPCDRVKSIAFLYINSTTKFANRSYERFVREVGPITRLGIKTQLIQY